MGKNIQASRPRDITSCGVLQALAGSDLELLYLCSDKRGALYGEELHTGDRQEWTELLLTLIQHGPRLKDSLRFRHDHTTSYEGLLMALPGVMPQLTEFMPGGRIEVSKGSLGMGVVGHCIDRLKEEWKVETGGGELGLYASGGSGEKLLSVHLREQEVTAVVTPGEDIGIITGQTDIFHKANW